MPSKLEPGSFLLCRLAARLDGLADGPHLVLGQEVLEVAEELDDLLVPVQLVRDLLEPAQVILNGKKVNNKIISLHIFNFIFLFTCYVCQIKTVSMSYL